METDTMHGPMDAYDRDGILLGRYCQGDSQAFDELFRRYAGMVLATCRRELGERELAEDATQAVFLLLAKKARSLRRERCVAVWLFSTAILLSKQCRRAEARRMKKTAALQDRTNQAASEEPSWWAIAPHVNAALQALRHEERQILLLRFAGDLSHREIGERLGIAEDAARMRVQRGLEALRRKLRGQDLDVSAVVLPTLLGTHFAPPTPAGFRPSTVPNASTMNILHLTHLAHLKTAGLVGVAMIAGSFGAFKARAAVQGVAQTHPETLATKPKATPPVGTLPFALITWPDPASHSSSETWTTYMRLPLLEPDKPMTIPLQVVNGSLVPGPASSDAIQFKMQAKGDERSATVSIDVSADGSTSSVLTSTSPKQYIGFVPGTTGTAHGDSLEQVAKNLAGMQHVQPPAPTRLNKWRMAVVYLGGTPPPSAAAPTPFVCSATIVRDGQVISKPTIRTLEKMNFSLNTQFDNAAGGPSQMQTAATPTVEGGSIRLRGSLGLMVDGISVGAEFSVLTKTSPAEVGYVVGRPDKGLGRITQSGVLPRAAFLATSPTDLGKTLGVAPGDVIWVFDTSIVRDDE